MMVSTCRKCGVRPYDVLYLLGELEFAEADLAAVRETLYSDALYRSLVDKAREHAETNPVASYGPGWLPGYAEGVEHTIEILRMRSGQADEITRHA
jgi:hypothetical protein